MTLTQRSNWSMLSVQLVLLRTKLSSFMPMLVENPLGHKEYYGSLVTPRSPHLSQDHYISFPTPIRKCLFNPSTLPFSRILKTAIPSGKTLVYRLGLVICIVPSVCIARSSSSLLSA